MSTNHSHSADEYLMTIWLLAYPVGEYQPSRRGPQPTAPARIADQLGVSRASVGEMLKRLEGQGLVIRGEKKEAILTERGRILAMKTVRRHRMVELFLTDVLGYSGAESHERCDGLDDGFDDDMVERLWEQLGRPERCPHGYPVDARHELRENPTLVPIGMMREEDTGEIVRLAEHDTDLLHFYYDAHLVPQTKITLTQAGSNGSVLIQCDGLPDEVLLTAEQASGLYVRKTGIPVVPADAQCWAEKSQTK